MSRDVHVQLLPRHFEPEALRGGIAVVIDLLRATTTIVTALANGARCVLPCGDIETARRLAAGLPAGTVLLGGERGGVRIEDFDLDNSPVAYSPERVAGKTLVFTTTNGTAALLRSREADRVLVGSLINRRAVARTIAADDRPVHLVCAGTDGHVTAEDVAAAGAIVAELEALLGDKMSADDTAFIAAKFWAAESTTSERLLDVLRRSRGGSNLVELGFDRDIEFAARVDSFELVAEYFPRTGDVQAVRSNAVPLPYGRT
jgi:2-phosphosulfolactate phosphatase